MIVNFEYETQYGKFADALYFPDDQPLPSELDIEAMKQQRLDNWIAVITTPAPIIDIDNLDPPPPPPPPFIDLPLE